MQIRRVNALAFLRALIFGYYDFKVNYKINAGFSPGGDLISR
jgi:hypothetical protein